MSTQSARFARRTASLALIWVTASWGLASAADAPSADPFPSGGAANDAPKPKTASSANQGTNPRDRRIRLNYKAVPWSKVLARVARRAGLSLVAKRCPTGTYTRSDMNQYTVAEALWVLNRDLEPQGYRLVRQGEFLLVLDLDDLRSDYRPAVARRERTQNGSMSERATESADSGGQAVSSAGDDPFGDSKTSGTRAQTAAAETAPHDATPNDSSGGNRADAGNEKQPRLIRVNFFSTPWSRVLPKFAEQAGLVLVMKRCPSGSFNHPDFKKYTVPEAIDILNHALDDTSFRLIRQDDFLIVLYLEDIRADYERPVVRSRRRETDRDDRSLRDRMSNAAPAAAQSDSSVVPAAAVTGGEASPSVGDGSRIEPATFESPGPRTTPREMAPQRILDPRENVRAAEPQPEETTYFVPQHARSKAIASRLYTALNDRTELVAAGPQGQPRFRVFVPSGLKDRQVKRPAAPGAAESPPRFAFTIGIDADQSRLIVAAPRNVLPAVLRVCQTLDETDDSGAANLQLVSADMATCTVAQNLAPELGRLVAQRDGNESAVQVVPVAQLPPSSTPPGGQGGQPPKPASPSQPGIAEIIKGLKGDVSVESVPDLGILILRGSQTDVDAVMKVIREIGRLSAGATPKIHLLLLQYVNSESFAKLLNEVYKALMGLRTAEKEAKQLIQLFPIAKPNAVLILAAPADMPSVLELAKQLDQPVIPETEFQVFHLRRGYATQVAKSITDFYKGRGNLGTMVNVFADPRTNSVVVQARPRDLVEVAKLVEKLDEPTASQATIKVFPLQNGDATSIVRLLETLFGTTQRGAGTPGATPFGGGGQNETGGETTAPTALRLSADVRTNSIIALGPPDTLRAVGAVIVRLDNSDVHQRKTEVIRLKNNASDNVARAITDFVRSQRELTQIEPEAVSSVELLEREVFVVSEPISNSLLLSATPRYFEDLKKMIDKLDSPPSQVIIQALIVEVELDNSDEFGIELGFQSPVLFQRSQFSNLQTFQTTQTVNPTTSVANNVLLSEQAVPGFQFGDPNSGLGLNPASTAAQVGSQELSNFGMGRINNALGFGGLVLSASSESVSALLRALSYKQTVHVLSRPQIRTLDNRVASIQVGRRVPVVYNVSTNTVTGAISPLVQYDADGIILTVQPRITPDGMIALEAYAEKSEYQLNGAGSVTLLSDVVTGRSVQSPVKNITRAEASVNVASGNTVVMGGMITSSDTTQTRKVPWIADVPIIGQAFRYDSKVTKRTELLIFLTPRVIRDDADDEMIKQVETERLHFLVEEAESAHGPILSNRPASPLECPPEGLPVQPLMPLPPAAASGPSSPAPAPAPAPLAVPSLAPSPGRAPGLAPPPTQMTPVAPVLPPPSARPAVPPPPPPPPPTMAPAPSPGPGVRFEIPPSDSGNIPAGTRSSRTTARRGIGAPGTDSGGTTAGGNEKGAAQANDDTSGLLRSVLFDDSTAPGTAPAARESEGPSK